jgi:hypothetical protein
MRRAVEKIGIGNLPSGPPQWDQFVQGLGGLTKFRAEILTRLVPRQKRQVMLLQAGAERQRRSRSGYGASGLDLEQLYQKKGFDVQSVPLDPGALRSWEGRRPYGSIVHVCAQLSESFTPREVLLSAGEISAPVRVEMLNNFFARWPETQLRPFVILETLDTAFDFGRNLLLRNSLAARLLAGNTRGVMAIGPYPGNWLARTSSLLMGALSQDGLAIGDLHTGFWTDVGNPAPALFTLDPDLPVWD